MIKKMLGTMCLIVFGTNLCVAQTTSQSDTNNWGNSIQGIQLSISMTNSVVETRSSIAVMAIIKNSSTNIIYSGELEDSADYDLILANDAGNKYHLIPRASWLHLVKTLTLNPGEQDVRTIFATIGRNTETGDYTLQATRTFNMVGVRYKLESNLLKVQIK